jgi:hypothetical protein
MTIRNQVRFKLTDEDLDRLETYTENSLETKSEVIRKALVLYLDLNTEGCNTNLFKRNVTFVKITRDDTDRE